MIQQLLLGRGRRITEAEEAQLERPNRQEGTIDYGIHGGRLPRASWGGTLNCLSIRVVTASVPRPLPFRRRRKWSIKDSQWSWDDSSTQGSNAREAVSTSRLSRVAIGLPLIRRGGGEKALIDPPRSSKMTVIRRRTTDVSAVLMRRRDAFEERRRRGGVVLGALPHAKWNHYAPLCRD